MSAARRSSTHVLAVGISSYAAGADWTLAAAAEHSVQFVEWAYQVGVPPTNIHLFLSSDDHQRFTTRLQPLNVIPHPATAASLREFRTRKLNDLAGDLFYFFWSGHGSVDRDLRRILFYEEQATRAYEPFDLNDFVRQIRSEGYAAFPIQIGYVDACANSFDSLGLGGYAGTYQAPRGEQERRNVRQMWFFAADSGRQARAGVFSQALLEELRRRSADTPSEWPVDHDAVVDAVRAMLRGADASGDVQRPVQLTWMNSDGDEKVVGDLPAEEFVNDVAAGWGCPVTRLRRLAQVATAMPSLRDAAGRTELYATVSAAAGVSLPPERGSRAARTDLDILYIVASAFHWQSPNDEQSLVLKCLEDAVSRDGAMAAPFARELRRARLIHDIRELIRRLPVEWEEVRAVYLQTVDSHVFDRRSHEATTLVEMIDEVTHLRSWEPPFRDAWEFLLRLARQCPDARAEVETFLRSQRIDHVAISAIRNKLQGERCYVLSIMIEPQPRREQPRQVTARLFAADSLERLLEFDTDATADTWEKVQEKVKDIVQEARKEVKLRLPRGVNVDDHLDVEFVMPHEFFVAAPDRFVIPMAYDESTLGRLHPVVVRWLPRANAIWLTETAAWEAIGERIDRTRPATIHWVDRRGGAVEVGDCCGLLALSYVPEPNREVGELLNEGFPFIVWARQPPPGDAWDEYRQMLEQWARATLHFPDLPRALRALRASGTDRGGHLTLFWDDPKLGRHLFSEPESR